MNQDPSKPQQLDQPTPAGLLLVDKQQGFTSMDVCAILRSRLRRAGPHVPKRIKVGHAGTLDPMATGLLIVLVGKATRLCNALMADTKVYEATIDLAHTSTTDDAEGELTAVAAPSPLPTREGIEKAIAAEFVGTIMQRPPNFSAINVGGKRAYDLARADKPVELAARPIRVDSFEVLEYAWPVLRVRVTSGKGTYIRSLARDLGRALNAGGMLTQLRRTRCGEFDIANAHTLDELPDPITQVDLLPMPALPPPVV